MTHVKGVKVTWRNWQRRAMKNFEPRRKRKKRQIKKKSAREKEMKMQMRKYMSQKGSRKRLTAKPLASWTVEPIVV